MESGKESSKESSREGFKMKRICSVCGKKRICRINYTCVYKRQKLCYKCMSIYFKAWYELNRERKCEYQRKYYAEHAEHST